MADPDTIKIKYYEMLNEAAKHKIQKVLMRENWINMMILRVHAAKEIVKSKGVSKLPKIAKEALDDYDVVKINNRESLVLKGKPNKVIIPLEDSFEIVHKAHLITGHGSCTEMNKWLSEAYYVVAMICTPVLYGVCQECLLGTNDAEINLLDTYTSSALINIMDMSLQPDKSFRYLLVFQDLKTKFVQLRPLTANELVEEIAMVLIKIFCDFFPPQCLVVEPELKQTFEEVLDRLNQIFNPSITLETSEGNRNSVNMEVEIRITKWMTHHSCYNWAVGCHVVQWEINNTKTDSGSPYEKFFGLDQTSDNQDLESDEVELVQSTQTSSENTVIMQDMVKDCTQKKLPTVEIVPGIIEKTTKKKFPTIASVLDVDKDTIQNCFPNVVSVQYVEKDTEQKKVPAVVSMQDVDNVIQNNLQTVVSEQDTDVKEIEPKDIEYINVPNFEIMDNAPIVSVKCEPKAKEPNENETHICCTCNAVMEGQVYFCCICKNSLHLYCGARRQSPNNVAETICYICMI